MMASDVEDEAFSGEVGLPAASESSFSSDRFGR
jgi:hypothetical protein